MEEISCLREKHVKIPPSQLKELLQKGVKWMGHVKNKQNQHVNEIETKIEDLALKVNAMRESLLVENQSLEHKNQDLAKHLDYVKELDAERKKFQEENHLLEIERNKLKICKPNVRDQELLEQGRKKYKLYKELTRIHWDYEALKENIKGYVSNKNDYIHHFSYNKETTKNLDDLLWREIHKSTNLKKDKKTDKENVALNV